MSAGLRKRELRLQGDLEANVQELIGMARAVSSAPPALVGGQCAAVVTKAVRVAEIAGQLTEAIRVQYPAPGAGP
jgi:hypothetical protein